MANEQGIEGVPIAALMATHAGIIAVVAHVVSGCHSTSGCPVAVAA